MQKTTRSITARGTGAVIGRAAGLGAVAIPAIGAGAGGMIGRLTAEELPIDETRELTHATYEQFIPAYQFGYDGATDPRYAHQEWPAVEDFLREEWESRNPGTWQDVKDAVRYAWESHRLGSRSH